MNILTRVIRFYLFSLRVGWEFGAVFLALFAATSILFDQFIDWATGWSSK